MEIMVMALATLTGLLVIRHAVVSYLARSLQFSAKE